MYKDFIFFFTWLLQIDLCLEQFVSTQKNLQSDDIMIVFLTKFYFECKIANVFWKLVSRYKEVENPLNSMSKMLVLKKS